MGEIVSVQKSSLKNFYRYRNSSGPYTPPVIVSGGTLTSDANYYYRTFTSSGTLTVINGSLSADTLVIAGGGGGGSEISGGGGAGGVVYGTQTFSNSSYSIVIGAGGAGAGYVSGGTTGSNGGSSTAGSFTAIGGGGGGGNITNAANGGSGGGAGQGTGFGTGAAGQGYNGGSANETGGAYGGGGGGGAAAVGSDGTTLIGGSGGAGISSYSSWATATSTGSGGAYAAGGSGGIYNAGTRASGTVGGGGAGGQYSPQVSGSSATVNTGSGGGGGYAGAAGGSGIVIIRYSKSASPTGALWQNDSFAQYLKVATPFSSKLGTLDYSSSIYGSGIDKPTTAINSPSISTNTSKFYGSSLSCGNYLENRYISTPTSSALQIGTNDFTIEGWYYLTNNAVSGGYQCFASHAGDSGDQQPGWVMILEANTTLAFYACTSGSSGWGIAITTSTTPTANAWHHIAVTRASGVIRMFLNGTQVGTVTSSNNIGIPASQTFRIGSYQYFPGPVAKGLSGYMQDFRFYIGAAKYTANFTVPAQIYTGG